MPYIKQNQRDNIDNALEWLMEEISVHFEDKDLDGALNYVISRIVTESIYLAQDYDPSVTEWAYRDIARAVAVFECAKLEFYRRIAAPKEDKAIEKNGDIPAYDKNYS
jgi:hypothetical protein